MTLRRGLTATLKIIELAAHHHIPVVPHRGGEVWGLHAIVARACADLAEVLPGTRHGAKDIVWFDEPELSQGYLRPSDGPGFGGTLNKALLGMEF